VDERETETEGDEKQLSVVVGRSVRRCETTPADDDDVSSRSASIQVCAGPRASSLLNRRSPTKTTEVSPRKEGTKEGREGKEGKEGREGGSQAARPPALIRD